MKGDVDMLHRKEDQTVASKKNTLRTNLGRVMLIGAIYALFGFLITELIVNPLRISRLTGIRLETVNNVSMILIVLFFIGLIVFALIVPRKLISGYVIDLLIIVFAVVCLIVSVGLFAWLFPMENRADDPGAGAGIILLFFYLSYLVIIFLSTIGGFVYHRMKKRKV
jgi:cation transport ATPase